MEDILTEVEQDLVIAFNNQPEMVDAVRKVITHTIYELGVTKKGKKADSNINSLLKYTPAWGGNQTITDEQLGQRIKVISEALAEIERAFEKLSEYKKVKVNEIVENKAI
jgi:hypothetical protein